MFIYSEPQNFSKSPPYFCPMQCQSKVSWRFRKILWPSQNDELYIYVAAFIQICNCKAVYRVVSRIPNSKSLIVLIGPLFGCKNKKGPSFGRIWTNHDWEFGIDKYGNTGCGVFKRGVKNPKDFCIEINIPKGNYWILRIRLMGSLSTLHMCTVSFLLSVQK